ncbi:MAG: hypothetical protein AAGC46_00475 [Solirubrobacteraceae bacterium]
MAAGALPASEAFERAIALSTPDTVGDAPADAEAYIATHLELLTELIRWAPTAEEPLRAAIQAVVDRQFSGEVDRLRRAPQIKE